MRPDTRGLSALFAFSAGEVGDKASPLEAAFSSLRRSLWGVGGVSLVINLLMLTGPLFMLQVYDRVLVSGSVPTLLAIGALVLTLYLFFGVLEGLRRRVLFRIGQQVDAELSGAAFSLSTTIPNRLGAEGRKLRPVQDLDTLTQFMSGHGPAAIYDIPWLPLYLGIVFLFHSLLGFVAFAGAAAICVLIGLNEMTSREPSLAAARTRGKRGLLVEEGRRNAEAVHAMGMAGALAQRWDGENAAFLTSQRLAADWSGLFASSIKTIRFVLQSAILGVGAWLALRQEISAGSMIACSIMTSRALAPVEQAVAHWRGFIAARQSFHRLRDMLRLPGAAVEPVGLPLPQRRLVVDGLYCCPPGVRAPVIHGVSFDLRAGDGIAVLGPSGSGKTTLIRAIIGGASVLRGDIRLDGAELDQWDANDRGRFIGYLPQDVQLFDGTVAQNIARFDPLAAPEAVIEAALLADVHDLIVGLPHGYGTVIGSEGAALSGGERQRIALARALFGKPFLVVLDEPNSNLDANGEAALADAITAMRNQGSIVILVAHRPRAIGAVDKVLCLNGGRAVAFGPRDEIMRKMVTPLRAGAGSR